MSESPPVSILLLGPDQLSVLESVEPDVFDDAVRPEWAREFLEDPRHHLAVATVEGHVVGFASAVHYVHPDKPPELWINEVGVASAHRRRGIARRLIHRLFERAVSLGCREAWVLTERDNGPAMRLYEKAGGRPSPDDVVLFSFPLSHIPEDDA